MCRRSSGRSGDCHAPQTGRNGRTPTLSVLVLTGKHIRSSRGRLQAVIPGIDPTDEAAVADWTKAFNARPFKERDVILRGALPSGRADKGRRRLDQD